MGILGNKKLKDENKKLVSENLKLEKKSLVIKQQELKAKVITHDKATMTMPTTPNITNLPRPTLCIKETQTGIDKNLNLIPSGQLNNRSSSTTNSLSLPSATPLPSLSTITLPTTSTTSTTTNMTSFSEVNSSSSSCQHPSQCIVREPRPPPFPTITFLYNERSKYHKHMMEWSKEAFAGCERCFSVDNENYGCDACVWLKWWYKWHGDTHGFPDMDTKTYQKYL